MSADNLLLSCTLFLLLTICLGLIRVIRGPTAADRMLTAQLFGTSGVAIFLLLVELRFDPALRHIALVYALLAAITMVAFVGRFRDPISGADTTDDHPGSPNLRVVAASTEPREAVPTEQTPTVKP